MLNHNPFSETQVTERSSITETSLGMTEILISDPKVHLTSEVSPPLPNLGYLEYAILVSLPPGPTKKSEVKETLQAVPAMRPVQQHVGG